MSNKEDIIKFSINIAKKAHIFFDQKKYYYDWSNNATPQNPVISARYISIGYIFRNPHDLDGIKNAIEKNDKLAYFCNVDRITLERNKGTYYLSFELPEKYHRIFNIKDVNYQAIGIGANNNLIKFPLDFDNYECTVVCGMKNSGKSSLMNTIMSYLYKNLQNDIKFAICDLHNQFKMWDNKKCLLVNRVSTEKKIKELINIVYNEMKNRYKAGLEDNKDIHKILLVIDECQSSSVMGIKSDAQTENTPLLQQIASEGRKVGVYVLFGTQTPDENVLPKILSQSQKFIGWFTNQKVASSIGGAGINATSLFGKGDFILLDRGMHRRFQATYVDDFSFIEDGEIENILINKPFDEPFKVKITPDTLRLYIRLGEKANQKKMQLEYGINPKEHKEYVNFVKTLFGEQNE